MYNLIKIHLKIKLRITHYTFLTTQRWRIKIFIKHFYYIFVMIKDKMTVNKYLTVVAVTSRHSCYVENPPQSSASPNYLLLWIHIDCLQISPKMLCVSTKPVISHTLSVPEDSTQPTPFCLTQRTHHVHTAACRGRRHINTPGRTTLVENCWKKLCSYRFSPQALNTLGKVWLIPAGGAMRLDPISLWEMPLHLPQSSKKEGGLKVRRINCIVAFLKELYVSITDNSRPATTFFFEIIFYFKSKEWLQELLMFTFCVLAYCIAHHLFRNLSCSYEHFGTNVWWY